MLARALLEEVLYRCSIRSGSGDISVIAVAACLPGSAKEARHFQGSLHRKCLESEVAHDILSPGSCSMDLTC